MIYGRARSGCAFSRRRQRRRTRSQCQHRHDPQIFRPHNDPPFSIRERDCASGYRNERDARHAFAALLFHLSEKAACPKTRTGAAGLGSGRANGSPQAVW